MKEMEQLKQQAGLQREELEAEVQKIREDESFLRDHLSISVKVTGTPGTPMDHLHQRGSETVFIFIFRTTDSWRWSCWTAPRN